MIVYDEPRLCGLELWRGLSGGATLFQLRQQKREYFQGLREFLVRLHYGRAEAGDERETAALRKAEGFTRAVFCGGEALHPLLDPILRAGELPFAIEIDTGGVYAAKRGALRLFQSMGWRRGVALDLGQYQLKAMTAGGNSSVPRDVMLLPFGAHAIDAALGRSRLRSLVREGLSQAARSGEAGNGLPEGIVLALPVALDRDGVAQPATYPGLFGPVQAIFSGLFGCPWVVLNDAVLAALGFPPQGHEKTLVVTLGFGIGGALWER